MDQWMIALVMHVEEVEEDKSMSNIMTHAKEKEEEEDVEEN